jgi:hypothetical protein
MRGALILVLGLLALLYQAALLHAGRAPSACAFPPNRCAP